MFGIIHWAVRWKMLSDSTWPAIVGAIWKPLAPAPRSANREPATLRSAGHLAEWNAGPAKRRADATDPHN